MSHLDDELLAGAVIGDALSAEESAHLAECAACNAALDELREIADHARAAGQRPVLATPPARVWDSIVADIRAEEVAEQQPDVVPLRRPRRTWLVAAAASVAGVVLGGAGVALLLNRTDPTTVVASAEILLLADESPVGTATVVQAQDGSQRLVLNGSYSSVEDADLEVWLIDPNIEGMVSLGFVTADSNSFAIPAGYAVSEFPIVDVSVEPRDGVPTHSGDSVARGILEADSTVT
jgi:hypothetical protein